MSTHHFSHSHYRGEKSIILRVEEDNAAITAAIDHAHREISLLPGYRTRLIADVVTGKLDVREAATRLPEELEADEKAEVLGEGEVDDDGVDEPEGAAGAAE